MIEFFAREVLDQQVENNLIDITTEPWPRLGQPLTALRCHVSRLPKHLLHRYLKDRSTGEVLTSQSALTALFVRHHPLPASRLDMRR